MTTCQTTKNKYKRQQPSRTSTELDQAPVTHSFSLNLNFINKKTHTHTHTHTQSTSVIKVIHILLYLLQKHNMV